MGAEQSLQKLGRTEAPTGFFKQVRNKQTLKKILHFFEHFKDSLNLSLFPFTIEL